MIFQNHNILEYTFSSKQCIKQNDTDFPLKKKLHEFITEVEVRLIK